MMHDVQIEPTYNGFQARCKTCGHVLTQNQRWFQPCSPTQPLFGLDSYLEGYRQAIRDARQMWGQK